MKKGRVTTNSFHFLLRRSPRTVLVLFYLLISSPAFWFGCTVQDTSGDETDCSAAHNMSLLYAAGPVPVSKKVTLSRDVESLDVFVYDTDELGHLDTWEHFEENNGRDICIRCGPGDKLVCFVANTDCIHWPLARVETSDAIKRTELSLRDEDPQTPAMTGWLILDADRDEGEVFLEPLMSRITLKSLSCDFSGKPYEGAALENVSIYLTNVSASAQLMRTEGFNATDFINSDGLSVTDLASMRQSSMLLATLPHPLWPGDIAGPFDFWCYPNETSLEMPGTAFTHLVVQGDIQGKTCYYPISINRQDYGYTYGPCGISRNVHYIINLQLTRMGSDSPDNPVDCAEVDESGWIELHPGQFITARSGQDVNVRCDIYPEETPLDISVEDLEYDRERGIYDYTLDDDGHGVTLHCRKGGTGMFTIEAGHPVDEGFLIIVAVDP